MDTFLATFLFFGLAVIAMAVGVIFSNRRLRGSCGGPGGSCECTLAKSVRCPHRQSPSAP